MKKKKARCIPTIVSAAALNPLHSVFSYLRKKGLLFVAFFFCPTRFFREAIIAPRSG